MIVEVDIFEELRSVKPFWQEPSIYFYQVPPLEYPI